jgi:hypothetical protein
MAVGALQVAALNAASKREFDKAVELMEKAVLFEEQMGPPSGPPGNIKPSHELFGEILLAAGKQAAATEQFRISLLRQPNRARSLLGSARAAAQSGDKQAAVEWYSRLLEQWKQADSDLPELLEARKYLEENRP